MNQWLINIIHRIDILCNLVFWWIPAFVLLAYIKSPSMQLAVDGTMIHIWFVAMAGVIFIPPEATLQQLLGKTATAER